jgi:hypothetical protein
MTGKKNRKQLGGKRATAPNANAERETPDLGSVLDMMAASGINLETFGQERCKAQLREEHKAGVRGVYETIDKITRQGLCLFSLPQLGILKKPETAFPLPPNLRSCTAIPIKSLTPGTTHRDRVLRGRVAVDQPFVLQGIHLLLEDDNHDLVKVDALAIP